MTPLMTAECHKGRVTCTREMRGKDETFVLRGPTGSHDLSVAHTDTNRLMAHWNGFIANNGGLWAVRK